MTIWLPGKLMSVQTLLPENLPVARSNIEQLSQTQIPPTRVTTVTEIWTTVLVQISHPACRQSCAVYPSGKHRIKRSLDIKMFRPLPLFYREKRFTIRLPVRCPTLEHSDGRQHEHHSATHHLKYPSTGVLSKIVTQYCVKSHETSPHIRIPFP
jgi:hypothetical protein